MPTNLECPRLRSGLAAAQDQGDPRYVFLFDQTRVARQPQRLTMLEFMWARLFDGHRTLRDIQTEAMRQVDGTFLPLEWISGLVVKLDDALLLDGPRFREYLASPVRQPSCIGCYEADPDALRRQLTGLFTCAKGPGLADDKPPDGQLRAALIPHIDYQRGGPTFAWGFREVFERTDASLFVIIGTSHYSAQRFTLTRKDFQTPLGIAKTDQAYIDRLVARYGDGLFDDELAHLPEHSIELEVVFLQYGFGKRRALRIVPLVVGAFQDCVSANGLPKEKPDIARMIDALRQAEEETPEPICYIISGDLAHIGPNFGDPLPLEESELAASKELDLALLSRLEVADSSEYFQLIAGEGDRRRICGLPPTYTLLEAVQPRGGKLLHYDQYVHPRGQESVSFASMAFYR